MSNEVENDLGIVTNHCAWLGVGALGLCDLGRKRYLGISKHLEVAFLRIWASHGFWPRSQARSTEFEHDVGFVENISKQNIVTKISQSILGGATLSEHFSSPDVTNCRLVSV